jgi:hypothetical protein
MILITLVTLVSNFREQIARFRQTASDCDCLNVNVIVVSCFVVGRNYRQGGQIPLLSITRIGVDYFLRIR